MKKIKIVNPRVSVNWLRKSRTVDSKPFDVPDDLADRLIAKGTAIDVVAQEEAEETARKALAEKIEQERLEREEKAEATKADRDLLASAENSYIDGLDTQDKPKIKKRRTKK